MGFVLYQPFWRSFQSQVGGILPNLINGTRLPQFLLMFGPLLFVAAAWIVLQAKQSDVALGAVAKWTLILAAGLTCVLVIALIASVTVFRSGVARFYGQEPPDILTLLRLRALVDPKLFEPSSGSPDWGIVGRAVLASPGWVVLGLVAFLVIIALIMKRVVKDGVSLAESPSFVLLLFATGALLVLSVEFVYIRDQFGTRMNTVFKFYFQAWILWAIGGAYALAMFMRRRGVGGVAVTIVATMLIFAGLIYLALAIPKRAAEQGDLITLDGAEYLAQGRAGDYGAIAWLNEHVDGTPVILETPGGGYAYEGRISAHTGLPTVLGWAGHEHQWRGTYDEQSRRQQDIETMYNSVDIDEVLTLLDKYDIRYVYVGPVERNLYSAEGLAKFVMMMDVAYDSDGVVIYAR
jgi:uncharacterized membrane protein